MPGDQGHFRKRPGDRTPSQTGSLTATPRSRAGNVITWLPGRGRLERLGPVTNLASLAVSVHQQSIAVERHPPTFSFRGPAAPQIPDWSRRPWLWRQAINLCAGGPPRTPYGLLRADFHLGNLLWQDDTVTGLIDWAETRYWAVSDIVGFLPDPAHILVAVAPARPDLTADAVRNALEDLLGIVLRMNT